MARGAVEGAAYGAGQGLSEGVLGDPDNVAEHVVAGLGHGAIIGGAIGAATGGVATLFGEAGRGARGLLAPRAKDVESLAGKAYGEAAPGLGGRFLEASSAVSGHTPEEIGTFLGGAEAKANRQTARFGIDRDTAIRNVTGDLDELAQASNAVVEEGKGALKLGQMTKTVTRGNEPEVEAYATGVLGETQQRLHEMLADEGSFGFRKNIKDAAKIVDSTFERVSKISSEGGADANAKLFIELDGLKRSLAPFAKPGIALDRLPSTDQATAKAFDDIYKGVMGGLENKSMFGHAAEQQQAVNAAWAKQINSARYVENEFLRVVGREPGDMFRPRFGADPEKAAKYLGQLTSAKNDLRDRALKDWIDHTRELAKTMRSAYDLPAAKAAEVDRVVETAGRLEKRLETEGHALKLHNQLRGMMAEEAGGVAALASPVVGGMAGGPLGAVAGAALSGVAKPATVAWHLATLERATESVRARAGGFLRQAMRPAMLAAPAASVRRGTVAASVRWAAAVEDPKKFDRKVEQIRTFASTPEVQMEHTRRALGDDVWAHAPAVAAAVLSTSVRGAQFLASKAPPTGTSSSLTPQFEHRGLPAAVRMKFARYASAVEDPMSVLDDLAQGRLSMEGVESLRIVYPRIYSDATAQILEQMVDLKKPLPYATRLQVGLFLGAADTTTRPQFLAAIQGAYAQVTPDAPDGPPPRAPARQLKSGGMLTSTQQLASK